MEVEILGDHEFDLLEAACLHAEQVHQSHDDDAVQQKSPKAGSRNVPKRARVIPPSFQPPPPPPSLPYLLYRGRTSYFSKLAEIERACQYILAATPPGATIGFDMEWTVKYVTGQPPRPASLIQLCFIDPSLVAHDGHRYHCYLLHIYHVGGGVSAAPSLVRLLSSETEIKKAGVGIHNDSLKLARDFGIEMKGLVDLSELSNKAQLSVAQPQKWSLAALAETLLKGRVRKSQHLRCSDWERAVLTDEQKLYAVTDAWLSLRVWEVLSALPCVVVVVVDDNDNKVAASVAPLNLNAPTSSSTAMIIPARAVPGPLQPAKRAVLQQYMEGASMQYIAEQKKIQFSTVQSYIAEGIIAGHVYAWGDGNGRCIEVSRDLLVLCAEIAAESLKLKVNDHLLLHSPFGIDSPVFDTKVPVECSCDEAAAAVPQAAAAAAECGGGGGGDADRPLDVLTEVLAVKGVTISGLQAEMETRMGMVVGSGEVRLAFAHLGRHLG